MSSSPSQTPAGPQPLPRFAFLYPYGSLFALYPVVGLGIALIVAIVTFGFGTGYGLPGLFFHENPFIQALAGCFVTVLLGYLCFIGFLLDAGKPWLHHWQPTEDDPHLCGWGCRFISFIVPDPATGSPTPWRKLRWYLKVTWRIGVVLFLVLPSVVLLDRGGDWSAVDRAFTVPLGGSWHLAFVPLVRGWFLLGIVAGTLLTGGIVRLLQSVQARLPFVSQRIGRLQSPYPLRPEEEPLHGLALWMLLGAVITYGGLVLLSLVPDGWAIAFWVSPALVLCLLVGFVAAVYGFLRFHYRGLLIPVAVGLALWIVAVNLLPPAPYRTPFPGLGDYYARPVSLKAHRREYGQALQEYDALVRQGKLPGEGFLKAWRERPKNKPVLVVVSVSGGASRSALWTAVVLAELEKELGWDPGQVRLIAGASGGMVGASYLTATLNVKGERVGGDGQPMGLAQLEDNLARDHLTGVAQALALRDLPMMFIPFARYGDRGQALERAWRDNLHGALEVPFQDLAQGEKEGWRPSLVLAPMTIEDGRRLLISNLDLRFLTEAYGHFLVGEEGPSEDSPARRRPVEREPSGADPAGKARPPHQYSVSALEFFRLFPEASPFKLATAVRMQASFPYVSPAVALPTDPPRRVVDAGYYDNYGVNIAAGWVYHHREWLQANTRGVLLVQVRDHLSEAGRLDLDLGPAEPGLLERGLQELTAPPAGALAARTSVMSFRNDEQLELLHDTFNRPADPDFFTTVVFERPGKAAANWTLSATERQRIRAGMNEQANQVYLKHLEEWWGRRLGE